MRVFKKHLLVFAALGAGFIAVGGLVKDAWAHNDVLVAASGGQVAVGGARGLGTAQEEFDLETRVFEGVMIPGFPPFDPKDFGRDEPGFHALPVGDSRLPSGAAALPANAAVTLNLTAFDWLGVVDTMFYWDGLGDVDFQPASVGQPGVSAAVSPSPAGTSGGFGGLDLHPVFTIDDGAAGTPSDGVYLISPSISVAGLADSEPFYMLWLVDALISSEEAAEIVEDALGDGTFIAFGKSFAFFEEAVEHVEDVLAIPEPTGLLLLGIAALWSIAWVRRPSREGLRR